jgi:putative redox protein
VGETKPAPPAQAPLIVDLEWQGGHRFHGTSGDVELTIDSPAVAGPSPMQLLGFALAGCMAIDVAVVLLRGRFDVKSLRARLAAERSPTDPKRFTSVNLRFTVEGDVPPDRMQRALDLSREKYCSVWHSLRPDIGLTTSFEILAG